jgi:hypothetical protein
LAAGVVVAGAVSVDVVVVLVVAVPVVSVPVDVVVVAVDFSSTTAGACAAGALSGAAASFFWQPDATARTVAAAKPRVRNFFISLISFFQKKTHSPRERAFRTPLWKIDAESYPKPTPCQASENTGAGARGILGASVRAVRTG